MREQSFDIGVVIPLAEEFRYVIEIAPQCETLEYDGSYFYVLDFGDVTAIACVCNRMGTLPTLQATTRLLGLVDIKLLVLLGLGGALDDDIAVGDVVVAEEVNEFQANSKAQALGESYEVRYSGRHWPLQFAIREAVSHFEFAAADLFGEWQATAHSDYDDLAISGKEAICPDTPSLHFGPIASGNIVAASSAFVSEVRRINRKFSAIDMEAAGAACATSDRVHPIPCLVVRGMSDHANEDKKSLDEQGKRAWRRYCVRNAASFLKYLLRWKSFRTACSLENTPQESFDELLSEAIRGLRSTVGGCWLLGVAFGLYFHGPHVISNGSVVPMDVSRLRIISPQFADLLDEADAAKLDFTTSRDVATAISRFAELAHRFQGTFSTDAAQSLLGGFDQVVATSVCPDADENDGTAVLLLEAERLEEEVGLEAVVEYLAGLSHEAPVIRERLVHALARLKQWPEVIRVLEGTSLDEMARSELENVVFANAATGTFSNAVSAFAVHKRRFTDNAAKLFQQQLRFQFPSLEGDRAGGQS